MSKIDQLQQLQEEYELTDEETAELSEIGDRYVEQVNHFLAEKGLRNLPYNVRLAKDILGIPQLEDVATSLIAARNQTQQDARFRLGIISAVILLVILFAGMYFASPALFTLMVNWQNLVMIIVMTLITWGFYEFLTMMVDRENQKKIDQARARQDRS